MRIKRFLQKIDLHKWFPKSSIHVFIRGKGLS